MYAGTGFGFGKVKRVTEVLPSESVTLAFGSDTLQNLQFSAKLCSLTLNSSENPTPSVYALPSKEDETHKASLHLVVHSITVEVLEAKFDACSMIGGTPITYIMKISASGRTYTVTRSHKAAVKLVEKVQKLGYPFTKQPPTFQFQPFLTSFSIADGYLSKPGGFKSANGGSFEQIRKDMEHYLQSLFDVDTNIEFENVVQSFMWEPTTPAGKLEPIAENDKEDEYVPSHSTWSSPNFIAPISFVGRQM